MAKPDRSSGPGAEADQGEGFLSRWSRRKGEARAAEDDGRAVVPADDQAAADAASPTEPPGIDPATLPDIDAMEAGSDFSVFMQAGVPPALKTKALRKLWRVKPELANLDGLLDYGEDLTGSFKVVDHLKTAYDIGQGFLRDRAEDKPGRAASSDPGSSDPGSSDPGSKEDRGTGKGALGAPGRKTDDPAGGGQAEERMAAIQAPDERDAEGGRTAAPATRDSRPKKPRPGDD